MLSRAVAANSPRRYIRAGLLGSDVALEPLEFDVGLAQLQVLKRHGLVQVPIEERVIAKLLE